MEKQDCDRGQQLVAWLYGEVTPEDARIFEQHLKQCLQCRSEATAFRYVRNSIDGWRCEMLRVPSVAAPVNKPSAVAALREFFALAPLWLKGAVTVASITLLILVGTILMKPQQRDQIAISGPNISEDELARMVEERVQQRIKALDESQTANASVNKNRLQKPPLRRPLQREYIQAAKAVNRSSARRPLTRAEREQLAADLRLTWESEAADLDLLEDKLSPPED